LPRPRYPEDAVARGMAKRGGDPIWVASVMPTPILGNLKEFAA
jgi:hypothetical protein